MLLPKLQNISLTSKQLKKKTPHFLWNCKMRFGKTFAAYELARKMKWSKILILNFQTCR